MKSRYALSGFLTFLAHCTKGDVPMNRAYLGPFLVFVGCVGTLLSVSLPSVAASFSGRVVDESGKPVSRIGIALMPQLSETDETGAFSITNIVSPSVNRLILLPERGLEYEVRTVEIEGVTFYPELNLNRHRYDSGFRIAIKPGADVKDVEITVRLRMRIRGRVLSADRTPLRDAKVQLPGAFE